jgi:hypothetical protein
MKKLLLVVLLFTIKQLNAQYTITVNSPTICAGTKTILTATILPSTYTAKSNYTWVSSTGLKKNTRTVATLAVTPTITTIYTVTATSGTHTAIATTTITITSKPVITQIVNTDGMTVFIANSGTWTPTTGLTISNYTATVFEKLPKTIYTLISGVCTETVTVKHIKDAINALGEKLNEIEKNREENKLTTEEDMANKYLQAIEVLEKKTNKNEEENAELQKDYDEAKKLVDDAKLEATKKKITTQTISTSSATVTPSKPTNVQSRMANIGLTEPITYKDSPRVLSDSIDNISNDIDTAINKTKKDLVNNKDSLKAISLVKTETTNAKKRIDSIRVHLSAKTTSLTANINSLKADSAFLKNVLVGKQNKLGFNFSVLQSFPNFADDNPKNITQFHGNFTVPLRKIYGTKRNPEKETVIIPLRNILLTTIANNPASAKQLYAMDTTINKTDHVNLMDLKQNAFLTVALNLNLFTTIGHNYILYFDGFASYGRTDIHRGKDSLYAANFGQYGFSFTARSTFKSGSIGNFNILLNAQLFWIDPNTNMFVGDLNLQYSKLPYQKGLETLISHLEAKPFGTIGATLQYKLPSSVNVSKTPATSASSISSSTSPSFFYLHFGYNTNFIIGPHYLRSHNNYMALQIGYSVDFQTAFNVVKTALGK